ncbi:MAG: dephospho-CoA kinase [Chitinophagaceae bacterium]|nr:dephospho-CoA kinase [Chitinophagaceae bacterium]
MLRVGITGGIGSGKTTACRIFTVLGIPVYNADSEAKRLYDTNEALKAAIKQTFGEHLYPNGNFSAEVMRDLLKQKPDQLPVLNALVHPKVKEHSENWFNVQTTPYAIKESALLVESLAYRQLHKTILVSAPETIRFKRIQHRDSISVSDIEFRMKHQFTDEQKRSYCDYELVNDELQALIPQVLKLHEELTQQAHLTP